MRGHTRRKTVIRGKQAVALLYPVAAFLHSGGMSRAQSIEALTAAIDKVYKPRGKRELEHIGTPTRYADMIATWTRKRRFLDSRGRPRSLPLTGANSFSALARSAGAGSDPKSALSVLIRYRNARKLSNGRIQLVSPFFRASAGSKMAFEPIVYFLNDATSTLTHTLKSTGAQARPDSFWRKVDSTQISKGDIERFFDFTKERSLIFLEELDDWLRAHASAKYHGGKKQMRVGLGLFSIYSRRD